MDTESEIFIGAGEQPVHLALKFANRHGLIAGATGTGKTVTLRILAEGFSRQGVPVFITDVKGDLATLAKAGTCKTAFEKRAADIGLDAYRYEAFPVEFWDVFGKQGANLRTTPTDMGPILLSRLLGLNDTQTGLLQMAFHIADEQGLLLLDFKDLRSLLQFLADNAKALSTEYGAVSKSSLSAIQRKLLVLNQEGGKLFFGEPAVELQDLMTTDADGRGMIHVLAASQLMLQPRLYATSLLWLLAELFEQLPEVGDPEKPKLVLFFDEAHLLFKDAPKILTEKIEQVVRLIRSKGVGVFFITQSPSDVPDAVLGQLGNRLQHALRAFTAKDRKSVRAAAQTFRENPALDTETVISELGIGEALVSTLEGKGSPSVVQRVLIRPPASLLGTLTTPERQQVMDQSARYARYSKTVDRQSAHEQLAQRTQQQAAQAQAAEEQAERESVAAPTRRKASTRRARTRQGIGETLAKSVMRSVGSSLGRSLVRGILGSLFRR